MHADLADIVAVVVIFAVPIALLGTTLRYRWLWRSARSQLNELRGGQSLSSTPNHLMHAVDAIALEVERVSEGQRFLTKVLADREGLSASGQPLPKKDEL